MRVKLPPWGCVMKKKVLSCIIICAAVLLLASCGAQPEKDETLRVGALRGPTAMGMLRLMEENDGSYSFELAADASALAPALIKGELDIAALPANLAAVLYNNSNGAVKLAAVNTVNVLYIVERGSSISGIDDLRGRTLYATGEGAVPEYILRYILNGSGLTGDAAPKLQWCSDTAEALSYVAADENAVAMLPQPFVSAAKAKVGDLRAAIDLNDVFKKLSGSDIVTGVVAVRTELAEAHPEAVARFMEEYSESVEYVLGHSAEAAALCEKYGIVGEKIALAALPDCGITFLTGGDMKETVRSYLGILFDFEPGSVGGTLPGDDFYYGE